MAKITLNINTINNNGNQYLEGDIHYEISEGENKSLDDKMALALIKELNPLISKLSTEIINQHNMTSHIESQLNQMENINVNKQLH